MATVKEKDLGIAIPCQLGLTIILTKMFIFSYMHLWNTISTQFCTKKNEQETRRLYAYTHRFAFETCVNQVWIGTTYIYRSKLSRQVRTTLDVILTSAGKIVVTRKSWKKIVKLWHGQGQKSIPGQCKPLNGLGTTHLVNVLMELQTIFCSSKPHEYQNSANGRLDK